ncbi:MAG: MATE family efflux transporter [Defluviitaleaceae bacterium]|nr:MATE family efflux transporter [Defluviitaleaceae bacterium]
MWRIMLPASLQSMVNMGVGILGTVMVGGLGETAIAAASLGNQFVFFFMICCFGVGGGAMVMTSQYMGKGDIPAVKQVITLAIRIILVFAFLFTLVTFFVPQGIMRIYTPEADVIAVGALYLQIIAFQFIFMGLGTTLAIIGRSFGVVRVPLIASVLSFAAAAFFNWVFIFGNLGAPRMEIAGAALATVIARFIEFAVVAGYLFFAEKRVRYRLKDLLKPCGQLIPEYLRIGSPVIIGDLILAFGTTALAMIWGWLGSAMAAANAIIMVATQLAGVFIMGMSNASSIMVGTAIGENDLQKAEARGFTYLLLSAVLGLISSVAILIFTPILLIFYDIEPETLLILDGLMWAMVAAMPFHVISNVLTKGVLRGGGDTKFLMVADVLFMWVASIPLGYLAGFVLFLSPFWIAVLLRVDLLIKSIWCIIRMWQKKWLHVVKSV